MPARLLPLLKAFNDGLSPLKRFALSEMFIAAALSTLAEAAEADPFSFDVFSTLSRV